MAKVRVAQVEDKTKVLIDRGAVVDQEKKNLASEDKVIKNALCEIAEEILMEDEKSITLDGEKAQAMVSQKKSYSVDFKKPKDKEEFINELKTGELSDLVDINVIVDVNPLRLAKLMELLESEGYENSMSFSLNKKAYESGIAKKVLEKVVNEKLTTSVKYVWKK